MIRLIDHDEDQNETKLKLYEYHAEYLAKINEIIKKRVYLKLYIVYIGTVADLL